MNDIGTQTPYFSFLLCSHDSGKLINLYLNGQPIGAIKSGVLSPQCFSHVSGNPTPIRLRQVGQPMPFGSLVELKTFLYGVVDKIDLIEEDEDIKP